MEDSRFDEIAENAKISAALWADPSDGEQGLLDAMAASTLLPLTSAQRAERVASALLERASRQGVQAAAAASAFYRLLPEERLVLGALYRARWSYARISRVLKATSEQVQEIAWAARLHLASVPGNLASTPTPVGSKASASCPDYQARTPWTQRFLDEELGGSERIFFQSHLQGCEACRKTLEVARRLYYLVDSHVPASGVSLERLRAFEASLRPASQLTILESLKRFSRREEVRMAIGFALGVAMALLVFQ